MSDFGPKNPDTKELSVVEQIKNSFKLAIESENEKEKYEAALNFCNLMFEAIETSEESSPRKMLWSDRLHAMRVIEYLDTFNIGSGTSGCRIFFKKQKGKIAMYYPKPFEKDEIFAKSYYENFIKTFGAEEVILI